MEKPGKSVRIYLRISAMIPLAEERPRERWVELCCATSVEGLLRHLGLMSEKMPILVIIDGRVVAMDTVCSGGESVTIVPAIGGG